jgi:hypothetical protein
MPIGPKEFYPYESDPKCQEASPQSFHFYVPCGRPATLVLWSEKDRRHYWMCEMCADHNTRRGMVIVPFTEL